MTPVRLAFLDAATSAAALLADPAVAAGWSGPSALPGFSVGGLAVHLALRSSTRKARSTGRSPTWSR